MLTFERLYCKVKDKLKERRGDTLIKKLMNLFKKKKKARHELTIVQASIDSVDECVKARKMVIKYYALKD